jgi:hypothetical protein
VLLRQALAPQEAGIAGPRVLCSSRRHLLLLLLLLLRLLLLLQLRRLLLLLLRLLLPLLLPLLPLLLLLRLRLLLLLLLNFAMSPNRSSLRWVRVSVCARSLKQPLCRIAHRACEKLGGQGEELQQINRLRGPPVHCQHHGAGVGVRSGRLLRRLLRLRRLPLLQHRLRRLLLRGRGLLLRGGLLCVGLHFDHHLR